MECHRDRCWVPCLLYIHCYILLYIDLNAKVGGVIGKFAVNGRALGSIAEKRILGGTCT